MKGNTLTKHTTHFISHKICLEDVYFITRVPPYCHRYFPFLLLRKSNQLCYNDSSTLVIATVLQNTSQLSVPKLSLFFSNRTLCVCVCVFSHLPSPSLTRTTNYCLLWGIAAAAGRAVPVHEQRKFSIKFLL